MKHDEKVCPHLTQKSYHWNQVMGAKMITLIHWVAVIAPQQMWENVSHFSVTQPINVELP